MARLLEPQRLEIQASWDGDLSHAVDVVITVEIESEADTELPLLDTTYSRLSLKHSALWQMNSASQECTVQDTESVDDACTRYFSLDEGGGAPLTPAKNRTPRIWPTNLPPSPRRRLFPQSPALDAQETEEGPLDKRAVCSLPDHSFSGLDIDIESSCLGGLEKEEDLITTLPSTTNGLSSSSDLLSSPEILSTLPLCVQKCDTSAADHLPRKRTFEDARLSDSSSGCADEQQCDKIGSTHHVPSITPIRGFLPNPDFDLVIRRPRPLAKPQSELRMSTRGVERSNDIQVPKTHGPNSAPEVRAIHRLLSPPNIWGFSNLDIEGSARSKEKSSSLCGEAQELGEFSDDGNVSAAARIDYIDDLELPPSPTPSSKDLMPWSSIPHELSDSFYAASDDQGVASSEEVGHTGSDDHPIVVLRGSQLVLEVPRDAKRSIYKLKIVASVDLNREEGNFSNLLLSGLMPASTGTLGALFFDIPREIGVEFQTKTLHAAEIVDNCFKAHFILTEWLCISLRLCDRDRYMIEAFEVQSEIRTDSLITENRTRMSPHLKLSNYASCSVTVPDVCYSADKSCFAICVDGGPRGHFTCEVEPQEDVHFIQLERCNEQTIGVCHVEITCSPQVLNSLCIVWQVDLEGRTSSLWQPRVYPAGETSLTRERDDLRQRVANVHGSILFDCESDDKSDYSTDNDDYQSTSSSEMVLYPEESFGISKILLSPFQMLGVLGGMQSHSVRGPWRMTVQQMIVSFVLAILIYQSGLSQIHNFQGQLTSWAQNLEIPSGGIQALGHNIKQMARYGLIDTGEMYRNNAVNPYLDCICSNPRYSDARDSSASPDGNDWDRSPSVSTSDGETTQALDETSHSPERILFRDTETKRQQYASAIPVSSGTKTSKATMTVRDRVDYFLGWKGPLESF